MSKSSPEQTPMLCPDCGSDNIIVYATDAYMVNSEEFFCHSSKVQDRDAIVACLENSCNFSGRKFQLIGFKEQVCNTPNK